MDKRFSKGDGAANTFDAPLRENLASGILQWMGWTPEQPLYDFMCGSGTFLIEAIQQARQVAPGLSRSFAFEFIKGMPLQIWQDLQHAARQAIIHKPSNLHIFGNDMDPKAIRTCHLQLQHLEIEEHVSLSQADCLATQAPTSIPGVLLANPPYGVRMQDLEYLARWYPKVGDWLKQSFGDWSVYILSSDFRLPQLIGLSPKRKMPLYNGALECRLFYFPLVRGKHRPRSTQQ